MPAIRYRFYEGFVTLNNEPREGERKVEVFGHGGDIKHLAVLGFICQHGIAHLPGGGRTQLRVHQVTNGDGSPKSEWRTLARGEAVDCYWYPYASYGSKNYGVYVIVDDQGWPIIVPEPEAARVLKYGT